MSNHGHMAKRTVLENQKIVKQSARNVTELLHVIACRLVMP